MSRHIALWTPDCAKGANEAAHLLWSIKKSWEMVSPAAAERRTAQVKELTDARSDVYRRLIEFAADHEVAPPESVWIVDVADPAWEQDEARWLEAETKMLRGARMGARAGGAHLFVCRFEREDLL